jgi:ABC-2 type transport system permease protein
MNMPTDAIPGTLRETQAVAPAEISLTTRLYWAVRREFWESRYLYLAPLAVAALMFVASLITVFRLPEKVRAASTLAPMQQREAIIRPYDITAALLMVTFIIVGIFYCVEAFQRERRDRSILFWKSLPVSDSMTVLAKACIPFVVLPSIIFAVTVATQFLILLVSSIVLGASGLSVPEYWRQVAFVQSSLLLVYHLITVHTLGAAPMYAWLLLVSAWARRAALIWAVLPPLVISAVEKLLFNTTHFAGYLASFFAGTGTDAITMHGAMPMDPMTHLTPGKFLMTPSLWMGLILAAVFLAAAVRLRHYRTPV